MHKTTIATLLALSLAMAPIAMASLTTYDHYEDTQAPVGVYPKDLGNTAFAFCPPLDSDLLTTCDPDPGVIPALGGAFFVVDGTEVAANDWNAEAGAAASYGRAVAINVEQLDGLIVGGFAAFACTDYNDDIECDSGSFGQSDDDCDAPVKDDKDCGDPTDAGLTFCAEKDDYTYTLIHDDGTVTTETDDAYDDFVVFVEAWIDVADSDAGGTGLLANDDDSTDFGASSGTFRVFADWDAFLSQADCDALNNSISECSAGNSLTGDDTKSSWEGIEGGKTYSEPITIAGVVIGIGIGIVANWLYDCLTDDDKEWCEGERDFDCVSPITGRQCAVWIRRGPDGNEICR